MTDSQTEDCRYRGRFPKREVAFKLGRDIHWDRQATSALPSSGKKHRKGERPGKRAMQRRFTLDSIMLHHAYSSSHAGQSGMSPG